MRFRPATPADKWDVFAWRNTTRVRQAMLTQHLITADEHAAWWDRKQADPDFHMMLLDEDGITKAVQIFFNGSTSGSIWWAFYFTPNAPQDMGAMLHFWKKTELSGLAYAFDHLNCTRLVCEVLRSNSGVLNWHKRFGFEECDPSISENAEHYDLEVMDFSRDKYLLKKEKHWADDIGEIEIARPE